MIGYAEASAQVANADLPVLKKKSPVKKPHKAPPEKLRGPGIGPEPSLIRRPPPDVTPRLTAGGYVFPVAGSSSFVDTFGAPRGTIVRLASRRGHLRGAWIADLAVADGMVFSVGWNRVGGWRLWLRRPRGERVLLRRISPFSPAM